MEIRYVLTVPEFKESYFVMLRYSTWRYRLFSWQFTWLGPLMGAFLIGMAVLLFLEDDQGSWAFLAVVIGLLALSAPIRLRSLVRRQFRLGGLDKEIVVSVGTEGLLIKRVSRDAESRYGWSAIEKAIDSRHLITLLPNKIQFIPIPKRAMGSEEQQEFRALLAQHVPGTTSAQAQKTVS